MTVLLVPALLGTVLVSNMVERAGAQAKWGFDAVREPLHIGSCAGVARSRLWVVGGQQLGPPGENTRDIYSFDLKTETWSRLLSVPGAPAPRLMERCLGVGWDKFVLTVGGLDVAVQQGNIVTTGHERHGRDTWILDTETFTWEHVDEWSTPRRINAGRMLVQQLDAATPEELDGSAALAKYGSVRLITVCGNQMGLNGGSYRGTEGYATVMVMDTRVGEWVVPELHGNSQALHVASLYRELPTAALLEHAGEDGQQTLVFVSGGSNAFRSDPVVPGTFFVNVESGAVELPAEAPADEFMRFAASAVMMSERRLQVLGGCDSIGGSAFQLANLASCGSGVASEFASALVEFEQDPRFFNISFAPTDASVIRSVGIGAALNENEVLLHGGITDGRPMTEDVVWRVTDRTERPVFYGRHGFGTPPSSRALATMASTIDGRYSVLAGGCTESALGIKSFGSVCVDLDAVAAGQVGYHGYLNDTHVFDWELLTWMRWSPGAAPFLPSEGIMSAGAAGLHDGVYFYGGSEWRTPRIEGSEVIVPRTSEQMFRFSMEELSWSVVPTPDDGITPGPRFAACIDRLDSDTMLVSGGIKLVVDVDVFQSYLQNRPVFTVKVQAFRDVWLYHATANRWTLLNERQHVSLGSFYDACAIVDGHLLVLFSGALSESISAPSELAGIAAARDFPLVIDIETAEERVLDIVVPARLGRRYGAKAAALGSGRMLVLGGSLSESSVADDTWVLDIEAASWTALPVEEPKISRVGPAIAVRGGDVLVVGGYNAAFIDDVGPTDVLHTYAADTFVSTEGDDIACQLQQATVPCKTVLGALIASLRLESQAVFRTSTETFAPTILLRDAVTDLVPVALSGAVKLQSSPGVRATIRCSQTDPFETCIEATAPLLIEDLELDGTSGRGINVRGSSSSLTVRNSQIRGFHSAVEGGCLSADGAGFMSVVDSVFSECSTRSSGGAIRVLTTPLTVERTQFLHNIAFAEGGAVAIDSSDTELANATFAGNHAGKVGTDVTDIPSSGGAVSVQGTRLLRVTRCHFESNAADHGGALKAVVTPIELHSSLFANNSAVHSGGAVSSELSRAQVIQNCTFVNNVAGASAGAYACDSCAHLSVTASQFARNSAGVGGGGAVAVDQVLVSNVSFADVKFASSGAVGPGGCVKLFGFASFASCNFRGCWSSMGGGGGLYWTGQSTPHLDNSTEFHFCSATFGADVASDARSLRIANAAELSSARNAAVSGDDLPVAPEVHIVDAHGQVVRHTDVTVGSRTVQLLTRSEDADLVGSTIEPATDGVAYFHRAALLAPLPPTNADGAVLYAVSAGLLPAEDVRILMQGCQPGSVLGRVEPRLCEPCEPGSYSPTLEHAGSGERCLPCGKPTVAPRDGAAACEECPAGTVPSDNRITCTPCEDGSFRVLGDEECSPCPTQGVTCAGGKISVEPGYWQDGEGQVVPCIRADACVLAPHVTNSNGSLATIAGSWVCAAGHTGALCASCSEGYASTGTGGECNACWSMGAAFTVTGLYIVVVVAVVSTLVIRRLRMSARIASGVIADSEMTVPSGVMRIALMFFQTNAVLASYKLQGPPELQFVLRASSVSDGLSLSLPPIACATGSSFRSRFWLYATLPMWVCSLPVLLLAVKYTWDTYVRGQTDQHYARALKYKGWVQTSSLLLYYLSISVVTRNLLGAFDTLQTPVNGQWLLRGDISIVVGSDEHVTLAVAALLLLVLYVIILPGLLFIFLRKAAVDGRLGTPRFEALYSFIHEGLRPEVFYFELVVLVRRGKSWWAHSRQLL